MKILKRTRVATHWLTCMTATCLSIMTAIVYYPSLHYGFQFDDLASITRHFNIRHYSFSTLFFTGTRWISYWLNSLHYKINKFDPFCYRCTNLFIHIINGLLVYTIVLLLMRQLDLLSWYRRNAYALAGVTAALFMLHPVSTQTVSYVIQGQLEGLATMSIFLMVVFFVLYSCAQSWAASILYSIGIVGVAFLSCGTKEITIIAPIILFLVDWFFIARGLVSDLKKRLPLYAVVSTVIVGCYVYLLKPAFFKIILGLSFEVKNNLGNVVTHDPAQVITPYIYCISQFKVILHYLWIFICPYGMSVEYDWRLAKGFFEVDCFLPFLGLCMLMGLVGYLMYRDRRHPLAFGFLWFFCAIAPRSTIVPSPELIVDYKTYPASFGWLFVLACLLVFVYTILMSYSVRMWHSWLRDTGAVCAIALLGYSAFMRNMVWRSGLDFWGNVIANAPTKARAYNNYGVELSQNYHQFAEAIPYFLKAISLDKNYQDPCNNVAVSYAQTGNIDKAIEALANSLRANPYYPEGYNNLASFLLTKKDYVRARLALENAIRIRPYYGKALFNMGRLSLEEGKLDEAFGYFKKCCMRGDLDTPLGFEIFGRVSMMLQKYDDAIVAYKSLTAIAPAHPDGLFNLANAYALSDKVDEAIGVYRQLLAQSDDVRAWFNLGEALVKRDDFKGALDAYKKSQRASAQFPQIFTRMALCYEKLGDPHNAYTSLSKVLVHNNVPEQQKEAVRPLLEKLKAQYKLVV